MECWSSEGILRIPILRYVALALVAVATAYGAQAEKGPAAGDALPVVAATVDGESIFVHEVQRELARVVKDRKVEPGAARFLQAKTLQQLIDRHLILQWLDRTGQGASGQDVDLAADRLGKRLQRRQSSLAEYLERLHMSEEELRRWLRWQLGWQRFLGRYMTDENLERYFDQHRRQFDGTQMRVAHILLEVEPADDERALREALSRAKEIRRQIVAGETTFAEAARTHSAAPTGRDGGDIGLISRREPMPESFSRAATALEKSEVSEPVVSPFGVHLIQCLEIKPGQKRWGEVRDELESAVTQHLFQWAADQQRPKATIEFTGALPHFERGTEVIAEEGRP